MKRLTVLWSLLVGIVLAGLLIGATKVKPPKVSVWTKQFLVASSTSSLIIDSSQTIRIMTKAGWIPYRARIYNTDPSYHICVGSYSDIIATPDITEGGAAKIPKEGVVGNPFYTSCFFDLYGISGAGANLASTVSLTIELEKPR